MRLVLGDEFASTMRACARLDIQLVFATAMRRKRCGAVRAHNAEILKAVVVSNPVNVVEDQCHMATAPVLTEATKLTFPLLQPSFVKTSLEMAAVIVRAFGEDPRQGDRGPSPLRAQAPVRIKVSRRDPVLRDQLLQRAMVAPRRTKAELLQCLAQTGRAGDRFSNLGFVVSALSWHPCTVSPRPDEIADFAGNCYKLGSQDSNLNCVVQSDACCHYTTPQCTAHPAPLQAYPVIRRLPATRGAQHRAADRPAPRARPPDCAARARLAASRPRSPRRAPP